MRGGFGFTVACGLRSLNFPELSLVTPTMAVPKLARVIPEKTSPRAQLWSCVRNKVSNTGSGYGKFFQSPREKLLRT